MYMLLARDERCKGKIRGLKKNQQKLFKKHRIIPEVFYEHQIIN